MIEEFQMSVKPNLLAEIDQQPVLIAPERRAYFAACLQEAAAELVQIKAVQNESKLEDDFWYESGSYMERYRPYAVKDGVLQIPVKGTLLKDFGFTARFATGYDYIWKAFKRGIEDADVRGIALVIDSPGGMVSGCFDLVDKMFEIRSAKPVQAFASDHAYSAAYAIASVAQNGITVTRTGGVGSVGVVTMHVDWSKWNENFGIGITYISAPKGGHKTDGNPDEPLSGDVKKRIQARIEALYDEFVSTVARNRDVDEQVVRETKALTFTAKEALSNGMADSIGSFDDAVADFAAEVSQQKGDDQMSKLTDNNAAVDQAAVDNARTEGHTQGVADGVKAERERINAILGSDQAKARPKAALSAALKTDMSVEQASAFLADLQEEVVQIQGAPQSQPTAGVSANQFEQAMNSTLNPNISAEPAGIEDEDDDAVAVESIFAAAGRRKSSSARVQ